MADVRDGSPLQRDAAVARLRVIGGRAIDKLSALLVPATPAAARVAALKALDGVDDPRAVSLAIASLGDVDIEIVTGAIAVLRGWVTREEGTRVMEALTAVALDIVRPAPVRLAALDALSNLPRHLVDPLLQHAHAANPPPGLDDPVGAREWLASHQGVPLSELHEFIVHAREAETRESSARRRQDWLVTRAAAHAVLAQRGSRVALYDLRETFDAAAAPLPLDFLVAAAAIGDATCLEPMARAWAAAPPGETWWRDRLADVAGDIMHRTRLSGRSNVVKRIRARWTGFL